MEWTEENIIQLISEYEKHELLWKAKHPQHFNKIKKLDAWEDIARELGAESPECKKKMESLLSSLRREKAKIKKSRGTGKGKDEVYESNWFAFKSMLFLYDKDEPRARIHTIVNEDSDTPNLEETTSDAVLPEATGSAEDASVSREMAQPNTPSVPKKKRSRVIDDRLDKAFNILEMSASSQKEENECEIFGRLIAKKLQAYSPELRINVQEEILKIIFNADRIIYNRNQYPPPSQYPLHTVLPLNPHNCQQQPPFVDSSYQQQNPNFVVSVRADQPPSITSTPTPQSSPALSQFYKTFSPETPGTSNSPDSYSSQNYGNDY